MLSTWRISWRNITQNKKRFFVSLIGIILGVSFLTSMLIADRTTKDVFDYYEQMYVANADYWVLSDGRTFSEDDISSILQSQIVTDVLLALDKQAYLDLDDTHSLNQRSVRITGINNQKSSLLKLPVLEGSLDNEGLIIPEAVAKLLDKGVGDTIRFSGLGEAKISAIVEYTQLLASPSSWERAESSSFRVLAPLDLLRSWTNMTDELSYVRFQTKGKGEELFQSFQKEFQNSNVFIQPIVVDDLQSNDIGDVYTFFYLIAGLSMFISGFLVFNMIYTSVTERKKEFAVMKSFGYLQHDISKLIFIEVFLLSVLGTALGIPIGIWLGDIFMHTLLGMFEFDLTYTLNWKVPALLAMLIGVVLPIIFSLFPIYEAGKTSVLLTLKATNQSHSTNKRYLFRSIAGITFIAFIFINHPISYFGVLVGVILLFPLQLLVIRWLLKYIWAFFLGYSGKLSIKNITQQLNRNSNTAAILAIGIAIILLLSAVVESAPEEYENEIRNTYGGDIRITSEKPWSEYDKEKLMSYNSIEDVELLMEATPITWETVKGEERQFSVFSVQDEGPSLFEGTNMQELYEELASEPSIVLGSRAFDEWGGDIGEAIIVNTPSGTRKLKVIADVKTSHYSGYVAFLDEDFFINEFGWKNSLDILITLKDGNSVEQLRERLWTDFSSDISKVETVEDKIKSTTAALSGMNELILVMLVTIIGLASIGTANTSLMNTLERIPELGTMRALGFTKHQVRKMIVGEGLLLGFSGILGGLVLGIILVYSASNSELMGEVISFNVPISNIITALVAGILLSLFASWFASSTANKIDIISSLKEK